MKRSDVKLKEGDTVTVALRNGARTPGVVWVDRFGKYWASIAGDVAPIHEDGSARQAAGGFRLPEGHATHLNGVEIQDEVRLKMHDRVTLRDGRTGLVENVVRDVAIIYCKTPESPLGDSRVTVTDKGQYVGDSRYDVVTVNDRPRIRAPETWPEHIRSEGSASGKNPQPQNLPRMVAIIQRAASHTEMAAAMRQFCNRCDAGEIRSKRTYAQFKALLAEYDAL